MHTTVGSGSNGHSPGVAMKPVERFASAKLIGGVIAAVFTAGFSAASYLQTFGTRDQVDSLADRVVVLERGGAVSDAGRSDMEGRLDRLEQYIDNRFDRLEGKVDELIKRR